MHQLRTPPARIDGNGPPEPLADLLPAVTKTTIDRWPDRQPGVGGCVVWQGVPADAEAGVVGFCRAVKRIVPV
jgi:hypothetical protein